MIIMMLLTLYYAAHFGDYHHPNVKMEICLPHLENKILNYISVYVMILNIF